MKLSKLNPQWRTPDKNNEFDLTFDCPACGAPYRISIKCGLSVRSTYVWQVSSLPDRVGWDETVTITPSVNNTTAGHGRKHPNCGFHGTIINGDIV